MYWKISKLLFLNGEIQPKLCQYDQHWVLNLSISFRQAIFFYKMKNFCPNVRWAGWSMASTDYFCDPADSKDLPAAMKFREWSFNRLATVQPSSKLHRGMFHISTKKNYQDMWHVFSLKPFTAAFTKNAYIFESV